MDAIKLTEKLVSWDVNWVISTGLLDLLCQLFKSLLAMTPRRRLSDDERVRALVLLHDVIVVEKKGETVYCELLIARINKN